MYPSMWSETARLHGELSDTLLPTLAVSEQVQQAVSPSARRGAVGRDSRLVEATTSLGGAVVQSDTVVTVG